MEAREGYQVDCKLSEVRVQLAWEPQAAGNTTHGCRNEMVQVTNWKNIKKAKFRFISKWQKQMQETRHKAENHEMVISGHHCIL